MHFYLKRNSYRPRLLSILRLRVLTRFDLYLATERWVSIMFAESVICRPERDGISFRSVYSMSEYKPTRLALYPACIYKVEFQVERNADD